MQLPLKTVRQRLSREESRTRIVSGTLDLFRLHGFQNTSIIQVANKLQMTPANIYRHFASKWYLADAVCDHLLSLVLDRLQPVVEADKPADLRLRELVLVNLQHNEQVVYQNAYILDLLRCAAIEDWPSFQRARQAFFQLFRRIVHDGVGDGTFKINNDDNAVRTILLSLSAVMHPVLRQELIPASAVQESNRLLDLVLLAITR